MKKYFKPKSLTFWSALAIAIIPVLKVFGVEVPHAEQIITVATGSGLVGLRKALG